MGLWEWISGGFQQTDVHRTHGHQSPWEPWICGVGRDLQRDEAAGTCTMDGKVRAASLEVNFGHGKKCVCIRLISKQEISSFIQGQNFQHFNSKALELKVFFSCEVIVSMASKYFILIFVVFKTFYSKSWFFWSSTSRKKVLSITPILSDCCFCKTVLWGWKTCLN